MLSRLKTKTFVPITIPLDDELMSVCMSRNAMWKGTEEKTKAYNGVVVNLVREKKQEESLCTFSASAFFISIR